MNLDDAINLVSESNGSHVYEVFIPSLKKELTFKPITTGQQKTLSKFSMDAKEFNFKYELLKLSLFDNLLVGEDGLSSSCLTEIDLISLLAGLRLNNMSDPLEIEMYCGSCTHKFNYAIDFEKIIETCKKYEFPLFDFSFDANDIHYDLVIADPTYKNLIELDEYIRQMAIEMKMDEEDITDFRAFNKPATFIKTVSINGNIVEGFSDAGFIDKLKFYNMLPPKITFGGKKSILNLILDEFDLSASDNMMGKINCPNCKHEMEDVLTNDNFFII